MEHPHEEKLLEGEQEKRKKAVGVFNLNEHAPKIDDFLLCKVCAGEAREESSEKEAPWANRIDENKRNATARQILTGEHEDKRQLL